MNTVSQPITLSQYACDNPFYDNHVFSKSDMKRLTITRWDMPFFGLLHTTYVQLNEGYVFHYKVIRGRYYLLKVEEFEP